MPTSYVKAVSTLVLIALGVFLVYYLYRSAWFLVQFSFVDHSLWEQHYLVRGVVDIPFWLRLAYFCVWMVSITATTVMLLVAMHFANLIRSGGYFSVQMIHALNRVGVSAVIAGFAIMAASSVWAWMITFQNETERRDITFVYDSSEAGIMLLGAGVIMLAWVMKSALLMRQENEEFV